MVGVHRDSPRPSESFDAERRVGTDYFNILVFGFTIRLNAQVDRHAEQIEILRNLPGDAESSRFVFFGLLGHGAGSAESKRCVLYFEFRSAGGIQPLREKPG